MRVTANLSNGSEKMGWKKYQSQRNSSYLDWYFCDPHSKELPIRDVWKEKKEEPHYEDKTFNFCRSCNQPLLQEALNRGEQYIFFFTQYKGTNSNFKNKFVITGYYKIASTRTIKETNPDRKRNTRKAVRASEARFFTISDAFKLESIRKNARNNSHPRRIGKKRLNEGEVDKILCHFKDRNDRRRDYVKETVIIKKLRSIKH